MSDVRVSSRRSKVHVKKGQEVVVISGSNRGQKGKVLEVLTKKNRVIIEGVNMVTKAVKPSQNNPKGGFEEREGPIHASNVMDLGEYQKRLEKKSASRK